MHITQWKEPALSWNGTVPEDGRASILEIRSDDFMPQFLEAMSGADPGAYYDDHRLAPAKTGGPLKLYQPLHGCFYLVTASLVCRQLGLPDKAIDRASGESVFFVIRRRTTGGGEEAWIQLEKGGHWKPLAADKILTMAKGEERLPMHPVQIYPKPKSPRSIFTDNVEREFHYGYVPTGNRDKYKDSVGRSIPAGTSAATLVNDFINDAEDNAPPGVTFNFRWEMFLRRVYLPWDSLKENLESGDPVRLKAEFSTNAQIEQLYALLELGDFVKSYLPTLWSALKAGSGEGLPSVMFDLYDKLTNDSSIQDKRLIVKHNGVNRMLGPLLVLYEDNFDLVRGGGTLPSDAFDFRDFFDNTLDDTGDLGTMRAAFEAAIPEENQLIQVAGGEDNELVRLITQQVQPQEVDESEALYHIRAVYEYDPECPPVVSPLPSHPFQLTKFFDPDAPARLVRLEAPSMKPQDLRKYARGVGVEMSPDLHKLASCISGGDLNGIISSLTGTCNNGLSIQMVCTFSIQIIFLVAFIVMFTFLIMLNFIFWWLPYLRICLPIPTRNSS